MRTLLYSILTLTFLIGVPCRAEARTWYVKPDGSGDARTIQAGVDSAEAGDLVLLAPGTFTWTTQAPIGETMVLLKPGITLRGEAGAEATVIDAEMQGRGLRCEDTGVVHIQDLTVTRGFFDRLYPIPEGYGSGILSLGNSQPVITRCILRENVSLFGNLGGGIACLDGGATITDCQFLSNVAGYGAQGAGIYVRGGRVSGCMILNNRNVGDGAAGGGMRSDNSEVENCWFEANRCIAASAAAGAAILAWGGVIRRSIFIENQVQVEAYGNGEGGAIWCPQDVEISECIFLSNRVISIGTPGRGGAVSARGSSQSVISNCTFLGNSASFLYPGGPGTPVGGVHLPHGGNVRSSIIAGSDGAPCQGPITMSCTVLYQNSLGDMFCGTGGTGNLVADPRFCASDPIAMRDVRITSNSPCAPGQESGCGLIGAGDVGCEGVAVRQVTWGDVKELFR
jgi:hypothetical protein